MSKYKNKKTEVDGMVFDSIKEANRWLELKLLEKAGEISDLKRQVKYTLIPTQKIGGKVVERECYYLADFEYMQSGEKIVEDVKGYRDSRTAAYAKYVIKRKLMLERYGIRIREV